MSDSTNIDVEFGLNPKKKQSSEIDRLDATINTNANTFNKNIDTNLKSWSPTNQNSIDKQVKDVMVSVDRSGSAAHLIRNEDGSISSVRRNSLSAADVRVAVNRKLSANSSQINIFTPAVAGKEVDPNPFFTAADAIERLEGKGDFHEHLWPLESLSENYHCRLNLTHIKESQGLSEERAKQLIDEYGVSYLKY